MYDSLTAAARTGMDERVREFVNGVVDGIALNPAEVRDRV